MKVFQTKFSKAEIADLEEIIMSGDLGFGSNVKKLEEELLKLLINIIIFEY